MRALGYFVREAARMSWRRLRATLASVAGVAVSLAIVTAFLVVSTNIDRLLAEWGEVAEMSVYLSDEITPEQEASLERTLLESGVMLSRNRVSKEEAIERFRRDFPDLASAVDLSQGNPFPASIDVRLDPARAGADETARLARVLGRMPGVVDVRYDRLWIERLRRLAGFLRLAGWTVAALLGLASAATVAHVVRLGLYVRREEIKIMELVGAPLSYIRGPFVVEGLVQGAAGAMVALGVTWAACYALEAHLAATFGELVDTNVLSFLSPQVSALVVLGGMVVGSAGGYAAARHTP